MSIVNCTTCGSDIKDDKNALYAVKKDKKIIVFSIFIVGIILAISIFFILIVVDNKRQKEEKIENLLSMFETSIEDKEYYDAEEYIKRLSDLDYDVEKIEKKMVEARQQQLLEDIDNAYDTFDFKKIKKCLAELEVLEYDTEDLCELLSYDEEYYPIVVAYIEAAKDLNDMCKNNSYISLRGAVDSMIEPTDAILAAEINMDSKIGKYIDELDKHIMFQAFNSQYLYSDYFDLDYPIGQSVYAMLISDYLNEVLKLEL